MQTRKLGQQGLEVSALGLGCMGMSFAYGPGNDAESIRVLDRAFELGINFWDTAELYGPFKNEELFASFSTYATIEATSSGCMKRLRSEESRALSKNCLSTSLLLPEHPLLRGLGYCDTYTGS